MQTRNKIIIGLSAAVILFAIAPDDWYLRFDDGDTVSVYPAPETPPGKPTHHPSVRIGIMPAGMGAYDQIPLLAATGLSATQIVQRLGMTRSEVDLALKMSRCRRANAHG